MIRIKVKKNIRPCFLAQNYAAPENLKKVKGKKQDNHIHTTFSKRNFKRTKIARI